VKQYIVYSEEKKERRIKNPGIRIKYSDE